MFLNIKCNTEEISCRLNADCHSRIVSWHFDHDFTLGFTFLQCGTVIKELKLVADLTSITLKHVQDLNQFEVSVVNLLRRAHQTVIVILTEYWHVDLFSDWNSYQT